MPGLVGIVDMRRDRPLDLGVFESMAASLVHRPWYRVDTHTDQSLGVAVARIHHGILDQERQPHTSDDGVLAVFLDGELYDDAAATPPLERIAVAYRRHGRDFAAALNGSFVAIVIDRAESRVLIATDRTASRPLFYWQHGPALYLAPEVKALLTVPALERRLDWRAIAGFLGSGFWLNGYTALEGVRRVDRATVLTVSASGLHSHRYWEYQFADDMQDRGERYYGSALDSLVRTAVRRQVQTSHRYGVLLSGGYDSRGLLGCYLEQRPGEQPVTISWGADEGTPRSDCRIARDVAAAVGARHQFYRLRPEALLQHMADIVWLGDGLTAASGNYPEGLAIFAAIRHELGVDILLRGDECFGWHAGPFDEATVRQSVGIQSIDELSAYRSLLRPEAYQRLAGLGTDLLDEVSRRCTASKISDRKDFFYLDQRLQYYLHPLNSLKTIEVEARRPYLDNAILDFVATLPPKYRLDKWLFRRTVVGMFPRLFGPIAVHTNLVDWSERFRTDHHLQQLVHEQLTAADGALSEVLAAPDIVRQRLSPGKRQPTLGAGVLARGIKRHAWLYEGLRPAYRRLRRTLTGDHPAPVTPDIVFRLLTLSVWAAQCFRVPTSAGRVDHSNGRVPDERPPVSSLQEIRACVASPES